MKTDLLLEHEPVSGGAGYVVRALLLLQGEANSGEVRTPVNVGIVLDRSGSMAGLKLHYAKDAAIHLVRRLAPEDVVSVVAYGSEVTTVAEPATGEAQRDLVDRIAVLQAGSATNLSGGWLRGRELVAGSRREGAVHRILLLTDGLANVGITDPDALAGLCSRSRAEGITTTTIGFGADYDEHLLRAMADAGGGVMYYIENPDQAPAIFAQEIEGLLSLSAQNVTVEIRPAPAAKLTRVFHRYPREERDGTLRVDVGDLYAREPRRLLAEFLVRAEGGADAVADVAELVVTADVLLPEGGVERREIRAPIRASLAGGAKTDPQVRKELLLQEIARAREEAYQAQREGRLEDAKVRLEEAAGTLATDQLAAAGLAGDAELAAEAEDLRQMAAVFDAGIVREADAKYLYQKGYATQTSRGWTSRTIQEDRWNPQRKEHGEESGEEGGTTGAN